MPGPRKEKCLDCYYFDMDGFEDIAPEEIESSECHVDNPRAGTAVGLGNTKAVWPETSPDEWCGRFKRRDKTSMLNPNGCSGCQQAILVLDQARGVIEEGDIKSGNKLNDLWLDLYASIRPTDDGVDNA